MKKDEILSLDEITGRPPKGWVYALGIIGLLSVAAAILIPMVNVQLHPASQPQWWKFLYAAGALMFLIAKILSPYTGKVFRIKRLYRIESWSAVFFCVAAFFLFYNGNLSRDSWAFTLAGGMILIFTTIQIPRTVKKTLKKQQQ